MLHEDARALSARRRALHCLCWAYRFAAFRRCSNADTRTCRFALLPVCRAIEKWSTIHALRVMPCSFACWSIHASRGIGSPTEVGFSLVVSSRFIEFSGECEVEPFLIFFLESAELGEVRVEGDLGCYLVLVRAEDGFDVTAPNDPSTAVPIAALGGRRGDDDAWERKNIFEQIGMICAQAGTKWAGCFEEGHG